MTSGVFFFYPIPREMRNEKYKFQYINKRRDAKPQSFLFYEHETHRTNETFRFFCAFRVQETTFAPSRLRVLIS